MPRLLAGVSLLGLVAIARPALAAERPNIVFIYADDLGYGDLACYGATAVRTPNSDRLAKEGCRFTSAYCSSATCTPSRYSILTGQYAWRKKGTGILPGDAALIIDTKQSTLPRILQHGGYHTAAVGKWHLGLGTEAIDWNTDIKPGPNDVGFDYSFIMAATGDRVPCVYVENHRVVGLNPDSTLKVDYNTPFPGEPTGITDRAHLRMDWSHGHNDAVINGIGRIGFMTGGEGAIWIDEDMSMVFCKHAVQFIEKQDADHPFFLYYATHNVHVPRVPNHQFVGKTTMGPRGDSIVEFDWQVGQILATLDKQHLADNTLVILSSDNGPVLDDGYKDDANEKLGDHKPGGPFRGGKYSRYEGGTRVPFIVRWPNHVPAGTTSDAMISQIDFSASFASLTGQALAKDDAPDSLDVLPAILGQSKTGRDYIIEHANQLALRKGEWKFIPPGPITDGLGPWKRGTIPAPGALYNLANDPAESKDLSADNPAKLKELAVELRSMRTAGRTRAE